MRLLLIALATLFSFVAWGQDRPSSEAFPNCRGYIGHECCCTNFCCEDVPSSAVRNIGGDMWEVVASGQVLKRTGWSPEGVYTLCHCDNIDGKWTITPTSFARCLYVPLPNS